MNRDHRRSSTGSGTSCGATCHASTGASAYHPRSRSRPGRRGLRPSPSRRSSASTIGAPSPAMPPSPGMVRPSRCRSVVTGAAGPDGGSPWRSTSTAASGSATGRNTIGSARRRRWHRYCGPGASAGPVRSRRRVNGPSATRRGHRVLPPRPDHHGDPQPTTPGGATLPSGNGDKVAGRLAVRVAVLRQLGETRRHAMLGPSTSFGLLIQAGPGRSGGVGAPSTKRSGWAA